MIQSLAAIQLLKDTLIFDAVVPDPNMSTAEFAEWECLEFCGRDIIEIDVLSCWTAFFLR
jgi:hypothetical protein